MRNSKLHLVCLGFVLCLGLGLSSANGSYIAQQAYNLVQNGGASLARRSTINFTGAGVTASDAGGKTVVNIPAGSATQQHVISFVLDGGGSALTTGDLQVFPTAAYSCTINRTDVSSDASGSITVDIWKKAGAIPAAADKISASAPVTLSSQQLNQSGSISGWTTAVTAGDVFGGTIASAATVKRVTVQVWCQ